MIDATRTAKENEAAFNRGYSGFSNSVGYRTGKMDRWAADPVKARCDRGISNAGKFIDGLFNAVGSLLKFGSFRREGRSMIDQFDDNKGYSYTRQRYRK